MELLGLISFVLTGGVIIFLCIRERPNSVEEDADPEFAAGERWEAKAASQSALDFDQDQTRWKAGAAPMQDSTDLQSLVAAARDQAVELRGEQAQVASSMSLKIDILTNRLATIEALLAKALEAAGKSEASVGLLSASNEDYEQKLAEAERDLAFYRPLSIKLEDDLRVARRHVVETDRRLAALETEHAKAQGERNELVQKMFSAELARQRMGEENAALVQKLNEHGFTIQSLLRETACLKSETVSIGADLERAEAEAKSLADKYATEREGNCKATAALTALQAEFIQFRKDSAAQLEQMAEREKALIEAFSIKEKQFDHFEIKRSALDSKIDFLTHTNQRLREDLRGHLDHIGNLEASNCRLLDLVARNAAADDTEAKASAAAGKVAPKLRAVPDSQPAASVSPKPLPADRA